MSTDEMTFAIGDPPATIVRHLRTGEFFTVLSATEWGDGWVNGCDRDGAVRVRDDHGETRWFAVSMLEPVNR